MVWFCVYRRIHPYLAASLQYLTALLRVASNKPISSSVSNQRSRSLRRISFILVLAEPWDALGIKACVHLGGFSVGVLGTETFFYAAAPAEAGSSEVDLQQILLFLL